MATKGASNHFGNARHGKHGHITTHTGFAWAKGFNKVSLAKHGKEHMKTLKLSSTVDYAAHAISFANHVDRQNNISYIRGRTGQTVKFNKKTGEFVVVDRRGYITTYFKPSKGLEYYLNDRRKYK